MTLPKMPLSDFIRANMEAILSDWEEFAGGILAARHLDAAEARDHAKGMIEAIAADLDRLQSPEEQTKKSKGRAPRHRKESQAMRHGTERGATGFHINEEIAEFRALRACVMRLWSAYSAENSDASEDILRFNEAIDQALAESVASFAAEKELRANQFETLLTHSPDFHYIFGLDGRFIFANQALANYHSMSLNDILGKNLSDLGSPFAAGFQQHLNQVIATKAPYRGDESQNFPDGHTDTFDGILVPVLNADGEVEAVAGTAREISERKQLETELLEERELSDAIIESAPGGFFMLDQQNCLVRWNQYLRDETGLTDAQLRSRGILLSIIEEDRPLAAAKLLSAFATGYARMEVRVHTHSQGVRHYLKTMRRFIRNKASYLAVFGIDITESKQSAQALVKEKAFSDSLIEGVSGAFCVLNQEGNFYRWNSYLNRLSGLSDAQLFQRPWLLSILDEDQLRAATIMHEAMERGCAGAELRLFTADRGIRPYYLTLRRFLAGDKAYLAGVGSDITEWQEKMATLEHEAWTDPLTQIANRGHFLKIAEKEFARCRRYGHPVSVWMLDIDHFKVVNDTYGHPAGDVTLQSMVNISQHTLRGWDLLGRMGGEEFAVLLPETETEQSLQVAERLRHAVATATVSPESGKQARITVSIGIATAHEEDDTDLDALLKRADQALYQAKNTGRDKVCIEQ